MTLNDAKELFEKTKAEDPYESIAPALLNKWDIISYVKVTGMIFPFYEDDLKGITYDARLKGKCVYWYYDQEKGCRGQKRLDLQKVGDKIILEPNTIVFVTLEPYFQIPEYIALRYNFKIDNVYKGLLLGTGPIIDPGFAGYLSIPIHNLTDNTYELNYNDSLISIEFTKINPYLPSDDNINPIPEGFMKTKTFTDRDVEDYINQALKLPQGGVSSNFGVINSIPAIEEALDKVNEFQTKMTSEAQSNKEEITSVVQSIKKKTDRNVLIGLSAIILAVIGLLYPTWSAFNSIHRERVEYNNILREHQYIVTDLEYRLVSLETHILEIRKDILEAEYNAYDDKASSEAIAIREELDKITAELERQGE